MFTDENALFLRRCFDVGRLGTATSPNPSVGSIIVAPDGRIIGEGYTQPYGGAHAEVMAVASVKLSDRPLLPLSTIFVTLEPCFHEGRTKPCVDLILREKISKVVIAHLDPNPLVGGKSITKLQDNVIEVQIFIYNNLLIRQNTEESPFLNERQLENGKIATLIPFFTNMTKKRPYIILKWAESADGFIGQSDKSIALSNNFSKRLVHKWRSEVDAIMVGRKTAEVDNPELTNRLYFGKSPIRVVLDRNARLLPSLHLFNSAVKTIIFSENLHKNEENTEGGQNLSKQNFEKTSNLPKIVNNSDFTTGQIERRFVAFDDFLLENILTDLHDQKIGILFVEGGEKLLNSFIKRGLWDEARVFTAAKTIGEGIPAPQLMSAFLQDTTQIDNDTLRTYRRLESPHNISD
jgi:diaminohydroxyphosphoribosylaminopyrimidine deaminase / 5-amino-6-(5-phosphoribosylamino)uracil reductase